MFTFRKRIRLGPLVFNLGKSGLTSWGFKVGRVTHNMTRRQTSVDLPGPVNWRSTPRRKRAPR